MPACARHASSQPNLRDRAAGTASGSYAVLLAEQNLQPSVAAPAPNRSHLADALTEAGIIAAAAPGSGSLSDYVRVRCGAAARSHHATDRRRAAGLLHFRLVTSFWIALSSFVSAISSSSSRLASDTPMSPNFDVVEVGAADPVLAADIRRRRPACCSRSIPMICSSVKLLLRIVRLAAELQTLPKSGGN